MNALKEDYKLCAAIDFGTTYCGVVSSLRIDPHNIWSREDNKGDTATSLQEPTTVLLNPKREFCKMGTEAEKEYERLVFDGKHHDYFLFKKFKMSLHSRVSVYIYKSKLLTEHFIYLNVMGFKGLGFNVL